MTVYTPAMSDEVLSGLKQIHDTMLHQRTLIERLGEDLRHQRAEHARTLNILRLTEKEASDAQAHAAELLTLRSVTALPDQVVNATVRDAADDSRILAVFRVPVNVPVGLLRHAVAARFALHTYAFKMVYAGKTLADDTNIDDLGIDVGTDDTVYIRPNFNLGES